MLDYADLGEIVNTVGLKGELKLLPGPDFWPGALDTKCVYLLSKDEEKRAIQVEGYRRKKGTYILKLAKVDTIDEAERIIGERLRLTSNELEEFEFPEEILPFQLIKMEVFLKSGDSLGEVVELIKSPGQDRLIVEGDKKNYIIPLVPEIVISIDFDSNRIEIDPPQGLLDLDW